MVTTFYQGSLHHTSCHVTNKIDATTAGHVALVVSEKSERHVKSFYSKHTASHAIVVPCENPDVTSRHYHIVRSVICDVCNVS